MGLGGFGVNSLAIGFRGGLAQKCMQLYKLIQGVCASTDACSSSSSTQLP